MKTFGTDNIEWPGGFGPGSEKTFHVIVATKGAAWSHLCRALPADYVDIVGADEKPTTEALVWKHDRAKINCEGCLAVLDGAVVAKVPVAP